MLKAKHQNLLECAGITKHQRTSQTRFKNVVKILLNAEYQDYRRNIEEIMMKSVIAVYLCEYLYSR